MEGFDSATSNHGAASSEKEREWQERRDLDLKKWKEQDERQRNEGKHTVEWREDTGGSDLSLKELQQRIEVLNKRVTLIQCKMGLEAEMAMH